MPSNFGALCIIWYYSILAHLFTPFYKKESLAPPCNVMVSCLVFALGAHSFWRFRSMDLEPHFDEEEKEEGELLICRCFLFAAYQVAFAEQ